MTISSKRKGGNLVSPGRRTPESVDRPLFELFQRDVGGWRGRVEVEPVGVLVFLVCRVCELLLAVINYIPPLRVYPIEVLTDHGGRVLCGLQR